MRQITKEVLSFLGMLILAYLLLTHSTGFSRNVRAVGGSLADLSKVLQGR